MARNYVNLADIMGRVDQARDSDQRAAHNNMLMQRQSRQFEREDKQYANQAAVKDAYKSSVGPDGQLDQNALVSKLYQVAPMQAQEVAQQFKAQGRADTTFNLDTEAKELGIRANKAKVGRDLIAGLTPETYAQGIQELQAQGFQVAQTAPAQYDPNWIKSSVMDADAFISQAATKAQQEFTSGESQKGRDFTAKQGAINRNFQAGQNSLSRNATLQASANKQREAESKPLPATALKMKNEALDKLSIATNINKDLGYFQQQIKDGKLDFGYFSNLYNKSLNNLNMSTEESRNLASFQSTLEKLRNDSLRLNNGVQTDGDAQRAWNELFENINDAAFVKQRIGEIMIINDRAADLQKMQVESITSNYGKPDVDFTRYENQPSIANNPNGQIMLKNEPMPGGDFKGFKIRKVK